MTTSLRLKAVDAEDLAVVAACLQDALVLIDDMAYLPEEQRFVLVANRFVWEEAQRHQSKFARTTTGVTFNNVTAVKKRNVDRHHGDGILSLLTVQAVPGAIQLEFSGDAAIRLETSGILCHLEDIGEPWPTAWRPKHELD
jgi:hypothetical protein